jgi:hypothetical protein
MAPSKTDNLLQANDLYALKEDYCTKIEQLVESHANELQQLHSKLLSAK